MYFLYFKIIVYYGKIWEKDFKNFCMSIEMVWKNSKKNYIMNDSDLYDEFKILYIFCDNNLLYMI